ncbi:hypothetical protein C7450_10420 [Chelatococcus asaccharovorans]|uniref:Uncharacterized protein n=1 Tax=Chelatococcus asaccharovorans TaxID=28210 RepID=A0A2V3U9A7_9HYPH|nr:hypothetical protein C7450_10420 [Chelatococcus asaccharovorans]CAH1685067.1 conserved hypothetical protein [Chelatococcus asaccharovorans]
MRELDLDSSTANADNPLHSGAARSITPVPSNAAKDVVS